MIGVILSRMTTPRNATKMFGATRAVGPDQSSSFGAVVFLCSSSIKLAEYAGQLLLRRTSTGAPPAEGVATVVCPPPAIRSVPLQHLQTAC
jgi:hypothetical protein